MKAGNVHTLLDERAATHGSYHDNARIAQELKDLFRDCPGWDRMGPVHRESLDLIALKMARILSGKFDNADHWHDIAGYAELVVKPD
jgi:hypothetical protein